MWGELLNAIAQTSIESVARTNFSSSIRNPLLWLLLAGFALLFTLTTINSGDPAPFLLFFIGTGIAGAACGRYSLYKQYIVEPRAVKALKAWALLNVLRLTALLRESGTAIDPKLLRNAGTGPDTSSVVQAFLQRFFLHPSSKAISTSHNSLPVSSFP